MKDYYSECKAVANTLVNYLVNREDFDHNQSYTIDILDIDGTEAKVIVCDQRLNLTKQNGEWLVPGADFQL